MFTEAEIADMESDDDRERLLPLAVRRQIAADMRRINEAEARWPLLDEIPAAQDGEVGAE